MWKHSLFLSTGYDSHVILDKSSSSLLLTISIAATSTSDPRPSAEELQLEEGMNLYVMFTACLFWLELRKIKPKAVPLKELIKAV